MTENKKPKSDPSTKNMIKAIANDPEVKMQSIAEDFTDDLPEGENEWFKELEVDTKGKPKSQIRNYRTIIENDPTFKGLFAKDLFKNQIIITRKPTWRKDYESDQLELSSVDEAGIRDYIESNYKIISIPKIQDALNLVSESNAFHPVRDFLNPLVWDDEKRLDTLFIDYLGAADTEFVSVYFNSIMYHHFS